MQVKVNGLIFLIVCKWYGHKVYKVIPDMKPFEPRGECYTQTLSVGSLIHNDPVNRHHITVYYYRDYGQWSVLCQYLQLR